MSIAQSTPKTTLKRTWKDFVPLRGLFRQRWQILFLMRKEFFAAQRTSVFSVFWSLILPLIPISAYIILRAVVSGQPGEDGIDPMVYVTLGVSLWLLFRDMVRVPIQSVSRYSATIAQTELTIGGAILVGFGGILLDTMLRLALCMPVIYLMADFTGGNYLATTFYLGAGILFFFGFGLMSVPLTAYFPDIKNVYDIIFSYLIFFSLAIFPFASDSRLGDLIAWNPFAVFIDAVRLCLLQGRLPQDSIVMWLVWSTPGVLLLGMFFVWRTRHQLKETFL